MSRVTIDSGLLQMIVNGLKRDVSDGRLVRGEWLAEIDKDVRPQNSDAVPARELTDADIALCIASADKSFAQERISGKPVLGVWSKHLARAIERYLKGEGE